MRASQAKLWRSRLAGLAAAVLLVLAPGCGTEEAALGPEPDPAPGLHGVSLEGLSTDGLIAFLQPPNLLGTRSAGRLIRAAEGGVVRLGGFEVAIPAGALARDTYVTIDLPSSLPAANYVVAEFGPSGLRFARPVRLTLPLSEADLLGIDLSRVGVGYWNGSAWEDYGGIASGSAVSAETTHFSTYGARQRGGIDTTSGG